MYNNNYNISEVNEHFKKYGYEYVLDVNELLIREINKAEYPLNLRFKNTDELNSFVDDVLKNTSRPVYYISSFEIEDKTILYYSLLNGGVMGGITLLLEGNERGLHDDYGEYTYLVDLRNITRCSIKELDELFQKIGENDRFFGGFPIVFINNGLTDINNYIVNRISMVRNKP